MYKANKAMGYWGGITKILEKCMDEAYILVSNNGTISYKFMGTGGHITVSYQDENGNWKTKQVAQWAGTANKVAQFYREKIERPFNNGFKKWADAWTIKGDSIWAKIFNPITTFMPHFFKVLCGMPLMTYSLIVHTSQSFSEGHSTGDGFKRGLEETAIGFTSIFTGVVEGMIGLRQGTIMNEIQGKTNGRMEYNPKTGKSEYTDKVWGIEYFDPGTALGTVFQFALMAGPGGLEALWEGMKAAGSFLKNIILAPVKAVGMVLEGLWNAGKGTFNFIVESYKSGGILGGIAAALVAPLHFAITSLYHIAKVVVDAVRNNWEGFKAAVGGIVESIKEIPGKIKEWAVEKWENFKENVVTPIKEMWHGTEGMHPVFRGAAAALIALVAAPVLLASHITGFTDLVKNIRKSWKAVTKAQAEQTNMKGEPKPLGDWGYRWEKASVIGNGTIQTLQWVQHVALSVGGGFLFVANPVAALVLNGGAHVFNEYVLGQRLTKRLEQERSMKNTLREAGLYNKKGASKADSSLVPEMVAYAKKNGLSIEGKKMSLNKFVEKIMKGEINQGATIKLGNLELTLDAGALKTMATQYLAKASSGRLDTMEVDLLERIQRAREKGEDVTLLKESFARISVERQNRMTKSEMRKFGEKLQGVKLDNVEISIELDRLSSLLSRKYFKIFF